MKILQFDKINFGSYENFKWDNNLEEFKTINIFYGRNYSGKTTLSRIVRSFELKKLNEDFLDGNFEIKLEDGSFLTQNDVINSNLDIRVYNSDFVKENLSYLYDNKGYISGFKTLGKRNTQIIKDIEKLEKELGKKSYNGDLASGLYLESENLEQQYKEKNKTLNKIESNLEKNLTNKAKSIRENKYLIEHGKIYDKSDLKKELEYCLEFYNNIDCIKKDIDIKELKELYNELISQDSSNLEYIINRIKSSSISKYINIVYDYKKLMRELRVLIDMLQNKYIKLGDDQRQEFKNMSKDEKLKIINFKYNLDKDAFRQILAEVKPLLSIQITDQFNIPIELRNWLRDGLNIHDSDNHQCKFCCNHLSKERWSELENIVNFKIEEVQALKGSLEKIQNKIENSKLKIEKLSNDLTKYNFYSHLQSDYENEINGLKFQINMYNNSLDEISAKIQEKLNNIYELVELESTYDNTRDVLFVLEFINRICEENNAYGEKLVQEQENIINALRLEEVCKYYFDSEYSKNITEINNTKDEINKLKNDIKTIKEKIENKEKEIKDKQNELSDLSLSVANINKYLKLYFGHNMLELKAKKDDKGQSNGEFEILRNGKQAKNLSEGECSLVAFCYFVASLEDAKTKDKNPIIWIDDPISSLDNNHIFFIFSLIEAKIAKKIKDNKYSQLFISTHNLDFLKYLRSLTGYDKNDKKSFMYLIEKTNNSNIKNLPDYIRKYVTEFNYLFEQIFKNHNNTNITIDSYYSLANNIRKFLDTYMYFKYPNNDIPMTKYCNFFGEENAILINRVINEMSHLENIERAKMPLDLLEIHKVTNIIIENIKNKDKEQFEALLKSLDIEENDNAK
ncbi:AAA family ATPase [Campylobacter coli]|uniref:AAA family ATPase n=1 Tax=Campylobacter coli TaxID=195 RepID=UPI0011A595D6|nr:AAA family ATPase [Campylobacter coli]